MLREYGARAVEGFRPVGPLKVDFLGSDPAKDEETSTEDDLNKEYCSNDIADEKPTEIPANKQVRLLSIISELVRNYPMHKDAVIFFEEDGMIGLAPVGIKAGDFVCRTEKGVGMLREVEDGVWLIAKAMELSPLGEIDRSRKEAGFEDGGEELERITRG